MLITIVQINRMSTDMEDRIESTQGKTAKIGDNLVVLLGHRDSPKCRRATVIPESNRNQ